MPPRRKPNDTPILKATIENLAQRLAAASGGRITPNDLIPHLPVALSLVERHLDEMVDNQIVFGERREGFKVYEFSELVDAPPRPLPRGTCLHCGRDKDATDPSPVCFACLDDLGKELLALAERTAWPAEAVWQHEILYITAMTNEPVPIASIAGRSRMPLKAVKQRLAELAAKGYARQELNPETGALRYRFPAISYPRSAFLRHDAFIRLHPSSVRDEWEVKAIKSLLAILITIVCCFVVAFAGVPAPVLALMGALGAGVAVWRIMSSKIDIEPGRIERE